MSPDVVLRDVTYEDLPVFFLQQLDPEAHFMAAFTSGDEGDWGAFLSHWNRILDSPSITRRTILADGQVAGSVLCFELFGKPSVSYWLGRDYWGRGIATRALEEFLHVVAVRPLHARAAKDNLASLRVLEKCGFTRCGEDRGFSKARGVEVDEVLLELAG